MFIQKQKHQWMTLLLIVLTLALTACPTAPAADTDASVETAAAEATEEPAEEAAEGEGAETGEADLAAIKAYAIENAEDMKAGSAELLAVAQRYYDLAAANDFDYAATLSANPDEFPGLVAAAQAAWLKTSVAYELDEGIVAGVPSLTYYDVLIDAGASTEEDPAEALEWTLILPNGTELVSPGNYFHSLLEPLLWQTKAEFVVDVEGQSLPDANYFLGTAQGLDAATQEMLDAIHAWEPTLSDAFTALVVMIPTMNEYFEQWKLSAFVSGDGAEETAFVAQSRLFDIVSILNGLNVTYQNVSVLVENADADQHAQIAAGFEDLMTYVDDLYDQEQAGTVFTAEEADLFGTEAQDKATALAGQVAQAAALLEVEVQE
jgi:hypothetical protein